MNQHKCYITGEAYPKAALILGVAIRSNLKELIAADHPGFTDDKYININTLQQYRKKYLQNIIDNETGMAVKAEQDMVAAITAQELMATDNNKDAPLSTGEKMADKVAEFGGSWTFIISFGTVLAVWIVLNSVFLLSKAFDPYPYILLNLVLSCIAALQAPIIMMSQNRQETKDRQRSEYDYKVNLKAELEIRMLHEKLDHLMIIQMQKIMEFQQMQMDYMEEMNDRLTEHIADE